MPASSGVVSVDDPLFATTTGANSSVVFFPRQVART